MWSKKFSFSSTKLSYRLAFVYFCFFVPCFVLAFGSLYYLTSNFIEKRERDVLEILAQQIQQEYEEHDIEGLNELVKNLHSKDQIQRILIRLIDVKQKSIFTHIPEDTTKFEIPKVDQVILKDLDKHYLDWQIIKINDGEESMYEFKVYRLKSGETLAIGKTTDERDELLAKFLDIFLVLLIPVLAIGSLGAILIAQRMLRPINSLSESIGEISTGKLSSRVPLPKIQDELYELSLAYNKMGAHIETLIKTLNETVDNIAHDLKTPISRARISTEIALKSEDCLQYKEALENNLESSDEILLMVQSVLLMARYGSRSFKLNLSTFKIDELFEEVIDLYSFVAEEKNISLQIMANGLTMTADRSLVKQSLANLVDNAIKYSSPNTSVILSAHFSRFEICLSVKDQGVGIAQEELESVWERLYRSDKSRHEPGLGLGLSMVKAIVLAHEGRVSIKSQMGEGSEFILCFNFNKLN